jgi:hypothetical protein
MTGASDTELYATERYGHFSYAIPVAMEGTYSLALHFAEFYFGPKAFGYRRRGPPPLQRDE